MCVFLYTIYILNALGFCILLLADYTTVIQYYTALYIIYLCLMFFKDYNPNVQRDKTYYGKLQISASISWP